MFIVSPKTVSEAPGTQYKLIEPQERSNETEHIAIYIMTNGSSDSVNTEIDEEQTVNDDSSSGDKF